MVNRLLRLLRRRKTPGQTPVHHRKKDILEKDMDSTTSSSSSHSCGSCPQAFKSRAYDNYATPADLDMSCRSGTATVTSSGSCAAMEMTMAKSAKPQKSTLRPKKDRYRLDLDASATTASTHQSGSHADGSVLLCPSASYASNDVECRLFTTELSSITSTRATPTRDNRYHQQETFEEVPQGTDHPVQIIPVYATYSPDCVRPVAMGQYTDDDTPHMYNSRSHNKYSKQPEWKSEQGSRSERKRDASVILAARRQALMAQAKFYGAHHSDTVFAHQQLCNELASGRFSESVVDSEMQPTVRSRRANSIVSRSA